MRAARLPAGPGRGGPDLQLLLHGQHEDSQLTDSVRLLLMAAPLGILLTNISFYIATLSQHSEQIKKELNSLFLRIVFSFLQIYFQIWLFGRRRKAGELSQTCGR